MGQSRPSASGSQDQDPPETGVSTVPLDRTDTAAEKEAAGEPDTERPTRSSRTKEKEAKRGGVRGFFGELPGLILIAFILALVIKSFLVQAFFIPSQSMVPTLRVGDRVLVNKLVYDFGDIQRGDIIVFRNPNLEDPDRNL